MSILFVRMCLCTNATVTVKTSSYVLLLIDTITFSGGLLIWLTVKLDIIGPSNNVGLTSIHV